MSYTKWISVLGPLVLLATAPIVLPGRFSQVSAAEDRGLTIMEDRVPPFILRPPARTKPGSAASCGSGASQRSREALEPRCGVLGDLQPPHPTVRLEIVALARDQPAPHPGTDHVHRYAEALGRSRHRVAPVGKLVWKELAPGPVGGHAADPLFLPGPPDRPRVPGETSTRRHPFRIEDLGDLLIVPPGGGQGAYPLEGGRRRPEQIAPVWPRYFDLGHRPALPGHLDPRRPARHLDR